MIMIITAAGDSGGYSSKVINKRLFCLIRSLAIQPFPLSNLQNKVKQVLDQVLEIRQDKQNGGP